MKFMEKDGQFIFSYAAKGYSDFATIPDIETTFNTEEGQTVSMKDR